MGVTTLTVRNPWLSLSNLCTELLSHTPMYLLQLVHRPCANAPVSLSRTVSVTVCDSEWYCLSRGPTGGGPVPSIRVGQFSKSTYMEHAVRIRI